MINGVDSENKNAIFDSKKPATIATPEEATKSPIDRALSIIKQDDPTGEKETILKQALEYNDTHLEKLADTPIYHSTGSYGLAKILEHGKLESKKNTTTGEKAATGENIATTSFVIGGYSQSETVSYFYARKNERRPILKIDKKDVLGIGCEEDVVKTVFKEIESLTPNEQKAVRISIAELKGERQISDEALMREKMAELQVRKYYFDPERTREYIRINEILLEQETNGWKKEQIKQKIEQAQRQLADYESEPKELQKEMTNPFPVILTYEGSGLPIADLTTLQGGLVSERRTSQPIPNQELRQIQVPMEKIATVKLWVQKRCEQLAADSAERAALEKAKIVPLEFFESKQILKDV